LGRHDREEITVVFCSRGIAFTRDVHDRCSYYRLDEIAYDAAAVSVASRRPSVNSFACSQSSEPPPSGAVKEEPKANQTTTIEATGGSANPVAKESVKVGIAVEARGRVEQVEAGWPQHGFV
jgi:hypothetical protein